MNLVYFNWWNYCECRDFINIYDWRTKSINISIYCLYSGTHYKNKKKNYILLRNLEIHFDICNVYTEIYVALRTKPEAKNSWKVCPFLLEMNILMKMMSIGIKLFIKATLTYMRINLFSWLFIIQVISVGKYYFQSTVLFSHLSKHEMTNSPYIYNKNKDYYKMCYENNIFLSTHSTDSFPETQLHASTLLFKWDI